MIAGFLLVSCNSGQQQSDTKPVGNIPADSSALTPAEARQIAKEAYTYGYPLVDDYRIQYAYFVAKDNAEYKGPYNQLHSVARVFTPDDKAIQTPNSDTPYGMLGFDLRTEPMVLTIPRIEKSRYFSVQLIDAYTHNFDYIGSRATGNDGGNFLVVGPNWKGELPKGITRIIRCETGLASAIYRTQLFNPADLPNVKKIQAAYKVQPLSAFLGTAAPAPASPINFIPPVSSAEMKSSLKFFDILNFKLQYCPIDSSETALRKRFERIGVVPGKAFDSTAFSPEILDAIRQGRADSWKEFAEIKAKADRKEISSGELFGTRQFLNNNYAYRMAGALLGIYGNSRAEASYPMFSIDESGQPLDGRNNYKIDMPVGANAPVNAFWSLTMYQMPSSLLVANPLNRYLINAPMEPQLKKNKDGTATLYIGNKSPGKGLESNWLPAPEGPFVCVLRLYWPKQEVIDGKWKVPVMKKI